MGTKSILAALGLCASAMADVSPIPMFLWSPSSYFAQSACADWEVPHVVDLGEVTEGLKQLGSVAFLLSFLL